MKRTSERWPRLEDVPDDVDLVAISARTLQGDPLEVRGLWPRTTEWGSTWSTEVLLDAYREGLFPMPLDGVGDQDAIGWWSPATRAVFLPGGVKVSRSTRVAMRRFTVTADTCFEDVVRACGDPLRPQGWIDEHVVAAYTRLHESGHAHSVEVWQDGHLAGGLYGVQVGAVFAGESMFHVRPNASKAALAALASVLGDCVIDTQWVTDHLASLGAVTMPRASYLTVLRERRDAPCPPWPRGAVVT